jgi:hypothetical protein
MLADEHVRDVDDGVLGRLDDRRIAVRSATTPESIDTYPSRGDEQPAEGFRRFEWQHHWSSG